jgi:Na+/proline symporter
MRVAQMLLPSGLLGLLCFSIFGATVTALNSELNVIAQITIQDVCKNLLKSLDDKKRLFISRTIIVIVMLLCMVVAGFIRKLGGSFHYLITLMSLTTLPTFMPLLIGLLYKKTPAWGAVLSFCTGLGTGVILTFVYKVPTASMVFANFAVTLLTLIITGELWPVKGERAVIVEKLFTKLSIKGSSDIQVDGSEVTVNSRLIMVTGFSFLLLSVLLLLMSFIGEFSVLTLVVAAIFLAVGLLLAALKSFLEKSALVKVKEG